MVYDGSELLSSPPLIKMNHAVTSAGFWHSGGAGGGWGGEPRGRPHRAQRDSESGRRITSGKTSSAGEMLARDQLARVGAWEVL